MLPSARVRITYQWMEHSICLIICNVRVQPCVMVQWRYTVNWYGVWVLWVDHLFWHLCIFWSLYVIIYCNNPTVHLIFSRLKHIFRVLQFSKYFSRLISRALMCKSNVSCMRSEYWKVLFLNNFLKFKLVTKHQIFFVNTIIFPQFFIMINYIKKFWQ